MDWVKRISPAGRGGFLRGTRRKSGVGDCGGKKIYTQFEPIPNLRVPKGNQQQ